MPASADSFAANVARFTGVADVYDRHRPEPPAILAAIAAAYVGTPRLGLVVDLGSGTGLSTRYWARHAGRVIGIEPTADMRRVATEVTRAGNVEYREGFSHDTGLPPQSAQVISCMQALHWMEPAGTFAEAARVLVPGGIFLACDYDWPPATGSWEAEAAWKTCETRARALEQSRGTMADLRHWEKAEHLARMTASGRFRFTREILVHHEDTGDGERLVGLMRSQGFVASLVKNGATETEIALAEFRTVVARTLGTTPRTWRWSARIRLGQL